MTRSIHTLSATLQAVWTGAYQGAIAGDLAWRSHPDQGGPTVDSAGDSAEQHAWEAVRRANGGGGPVTASTPHATDVAALLADVGGLPAVAERLTELGVALERPACPDGRTNADLEAEIKSLRYAARNSWRDLTDLLRIVRGPAFVALSTDEDVIAALMPVVVETMWGDAASAPYDPSVMKQESAHARTALHNPSDPSLTDTDALIARVALAAAKALNNRSATAMPAATPSLDDGPMVRTLAPILAQARFAEMWTTLTPGEQSIELASAARALESPRGPRVDAMLGTYATIARAAWSAALAARST